MLPDSDGVSRSSAGTAYAHAVRPMAGLEETLEHPAIHRARVRHHDRPPPPGRQAHRRERQLDRRSSTPLLSSKFGITSSATAQCSRASSMTAAPPYSTAARASAMRDALRRPAARCSPTPRLRASADRRASSWPVSGQHQPCQLLGEEMPRAARPSRRRRPGVRASALLGWPARLRVRKSGTSVLSKSWSPASSPAVHSGPDLPVHRLPP
jgi:hypothetical protein